MCFLETAKKHTARPSSRDMTRDEEEEDEDKAEGAGCRVCGSGICSRPGHQRLTFSIMQRRRATAFIKYFRGVANERTNSSSAVRTVLSRRRQVCSCDEVSFSPTGTNTANWGWILEDTVTLAGRVGCMKWDGPEEH